MSKVCLFTLRGVALDLKNSLQFWKLNSPKILVLYDSALLFLKRQSNEIFDLHLFSLSSFKLYLGYGRVKIFLILVQIWTIYLNSKFKKRSPRGGVKKNLLTYKWACFSSEKRCIYTFWFVKHTRNYILNRSSCKEVLFRKLKCNKGIFR